MQSWTFGFEDKVDYSGAAAGCPCWHWVGDTTLAGYGQITRKQRGTRFVRYAHRIAYERAYGPIPEGLCVCHTCDNPSCVRPAHLFLGTPKDNHDDCVKKGRHSYPPVFTGVKLSESDVLYIRNHYRSGVPYYPGNGTELAAQFRISRSYVTDISNRKARRHVT
jgi:hypothetical protein